MDDIQINKTLQAIDIFIEQSTKHNRFQKISGDLVFQFLPDSSS